METGVINHCLIHCGNDYLNKNSILCNK